MDRRSRHSGVRGRSEERHARPRRGKKSARDKCCRWANLICGILIALGLIGVFFMITSLIIDGTSPLDIFMVHFSQNPSSDDTGQHNGSEITMKTSKNFPNLPSSNDVEKDNNSLKDRPVFRLPNSSSAGERGNPDGISVNEPDFSNTVLINTHRVREDRNVPDHHHSSNEWSPLPKIPFPSVNREPIDIPLVVLPEENELNKVLAVNERNKNLFGTKESADLYLNHHNTRGKISDLALSKSTFFPVSKHPYESNHKQDASSSEQRVLSSDSSSHIVRAREMLMERAPSMYPYPKRRDYILKSPRYDGKVHQSSMNFRRKNPPSRRLSQPLRRNTPSGMRYQERGRFGGMTSSSSLYKSRHPARPHTLSPPITRRRDPRIPGRAPIGKPRYHRERYPSDAKRMRGPSYRKVKAPKRVPPQFRYPPTAGSIQDIIQFMNERDHKGKHYSSRAPGKTDHFPSETYGKKYGSSEIIIGDQDHVIGPNIFRPSSTYSVPNSNYHLNNHQIRNYVSNTDKVPSKPNHKYDQYPTTPFIRGGTTSFPPPKSEDNFSEPDDKYRDIYLANHNTGRSKDSFRDTLPPVHNTYDAHNGQTQGRKESPFKLILDIYPANDRSAADSRKLESRLSVREASADFDRNQNGREVVQEVILHLNLFSTRPTHRYGSSADSPQGLSFKVPLTGSLSPLDIYRSIVAKVKQSPVAYPQTSLGQDNTDEVAVKLFDIKDGPFLYTALEEALKKANAHLPSEKQIVFPDYSVTREQLMQV